MASSHSSPFGDFQAHYGYAGTFHAPSPPAPVGAPLLDDQEQNVFDHWFDYVGSGVGSGIDPAHLFAPEGLPKDSPFWPDDISPGYQGSSVPDMSPHHHSYLGNSMDGFLGSNNTVSAAPSMAARQIDINPFNGSHELLHQQQQQQQQVNNHGLLNFGTDTNFAANGYHPPPLPPTVERIDKDTEIRSKVFSAFSKDESAITTAVNSPIEIKYEKAGEETEEDNSSPFQDDDTTPSPSRMGSSVKRLRAEDGDDFTPSKSARKPRPRRPESASKLSKKNKSAAAAKRDNLTEAQKRENHIHSEQKRRNLIRQGFEDLCSLVPELKSGGYSKSAVLVHAANYLDDLKKGNAKLRVYLQQLEGARAFQ